MAIPTIYSAERIKQRFRTGEEPILVMCSDVNMYVCKYMRSASAAFKLACELIGARMAKMWKLNSPDIALVKIKPIHAEEIILSPSPSTPSIGCRWLDGVVDITPSTFAEIPTNVEILGQLMKIALFDFWIANEDRNANNANLMYDVLHEQLVSIDYGCILNTATFDFPLSQLTSTDTILCSDLFHHLAEQYKQEAILNLANELKAEYQEILTHCQSSTTHITDEIPKEWNVPRETVEEKLIQLFDECWTAEVWNNFIECLNENTNHE